MTSRSISISVIVPVYNVSAYVGACIESILAQTFTDYELLLINDGSRDNSGEICDEYAAKDRRIRVIHSENRGVSVARNTGLASAAGIWVAFVDADDTVRPDYLKHLYHGAKLAGCVARSLVLCGFRICSRDTGLIREDVIWEPTIVHRQNIPLVYLQRQLYRRGQPFSKLYNRSVIEAKRIRFDPEIRFSEDLLFFLEYLREIDVLVLRAESDYDYYVAVGSGLSKSYSTFYAERKLFRRFVELSDALIGEHPKDEKIRQKEAVFFVRSLTCLYRPGDVRRRRERVEVLKRAMAERGGGSCLPGLSGILLTHGYLGLFDFVYSVAFKVRYAFGGRVWRLYCRMRWAMGK